MKRIATNRRRATAPGLATVEMSAPLPEHCNCPPLSLLHERHAAQQEDGDEENGRLVPATQFLNDRMRAFLVDYFPRVSPLSVVLLHVSQQEHIMHIASQTTLAYKRRRYHAPPGLLGQILANVRRAIRADDKILIHEDSGAALILPDVDRYGAAAILERIYHSIGLLQAETVIPPLTRETTILMGNGSYPEPGESLEHLLYHAGLAARSLTLRPALLPQQMPVPREITPRRIQKSSQPQRFPGIPFMMLPATLPARLKQLIPHQLALSLRCVPVGRDHNCLTVAMANPTSSDQIRLLREITGMTIFPVSCAEESLIALLEQEW